MAINTAMIKSGIRQKTNIGVYRSSWIVELEAVLGIVWPKVIEGFLKKDENFTIKAEAMGGTVRR